jgi:glutaminyl-peptide cyclotransferase
LSHNQSNQNELLATDSGAKVFSLGLNDEDSELKVTSTKQIQNSNGYAVSGLNELEHIGRVLFSNVYLSSNIEIIDLQTGKVLRELNMSRLIELADTEYRKLKFQGLQQSQCLNGIAYDKKEDVFYITGKEWPLIFKIKFPREYYS